eukprot:9480874-Ditylum_brightwellii.AAC.1
MGDLMALLDPDKTTWKERCADGQKQRLNTHQNDVSSPTVSTAALLLSCVIDVKENYCVATLDIPNAFMQADMDMLVNMKIEGSMAEFLVKIKPALYQKHLSAENGKPVLYICLKKVLYGTMRAALLFLGEPGGHTP